VTQQTDFESSPDAYQVKLDTFEGPLDLLLHLIRTSEVNIYDIPIKTITEQYLKYIELMQELNLDIAGEFLVMDAHPHQVADAAAAAGSDAGRRRARGGSARGAGAPAARASEVQGRCRAAARSGDGPKCPVHAA
jgi:hypothetical protein